MVCVVLFYGVNEDDVEDVCVVQIVCVDGVLVNIVDNLQDSVFIMFVIVDCDLVIVVIGIEGVVFVLVCVIKVDFEEWLLFNFGFLVWIGKWFCYVVEVLFFGCKCWDFWLDYYFNVGFCVVFNGDEVVQIMFDMLLDKYVMVICVGGCVDLVGVGFGDFELLMFKVCKVFDKVDVVIYDCFVVFEIFEFVCCEVIVIDVGKEGFGLFMI